MHLRYVDAASGDVLDEIDDTNGVIRYQTGAARGVVEQLATLAGSQRAALDLLADGWSNGYVSIQPA